ncbi:MAG: hypothetical protein A3F46_10175 [Legionellales bacterium RIFCSPHIGHO2_12_FULL_42_9]|nr:MAG: hypothetical protein A3F46_10175 [Legionellales bacterium RIFCSPHIGHO2_12_FULL_42_9]
MANNDPLNSESQGEPTASTTESGAEDKVSPAARNPCGICRASGSAACKGHGGGGGGGLSSSAAETGSVSPGALPATFSPATTPAPPLSISQFLAQNEGWESQDDSDALFKFENPEALFTLELDIEQGSLVFSGNDDLSAEEQETLNEFFSAMENELTAFKKELIEQGEDPELIDQIKFAREGNALALVLPTPMPAIYDALIKRLIDKNLIPVNDSPYRLPLQKIIDSAHVPAVSYACVLPNEDKTQFIRTPLAVGKKSESEASAVDENTRFPASSLSKIAFTYLVLQLAKDPTIDFDLDTPLYDILGDEKFVYERFRDADGNYPERAKQITAKDVLSHTTGLPNVEPDSPLPLKIDTTSERGEGYSYSGEAFLYLQKAIEAKTGQDLETLAKEYVFTPLHMERSTFLPQPQDDPNIVKVHSETGVATVINETRPELNEANAAGSLLTTADDFSKLMVAWLEDMANPKDSITRQAFKPTSEEDFMTRGTRTCGLGWHIYKNKDEVIAYQYGENFNTRSFIAINVNDKKGAVFFTNSINGSSIANQILNSSDLPAIGDLQDVYKDLRYRQSDVPGSEEAKVATIAGKNAEEAGQFDEARSCFEEALKWTPQDVTTKNRFEWFNEAHPSNPKTQTFSEPVEAFAGKYENDYGDKVEIYPGGDGLIYKQANHETELVQISETDFLPKTDQSFKVRIDGNKMSKFSIEGDEYKLSRTLPVSNLSQETSGTDVSSNEITPSAGKAESPQVTEVADVPVARDSEPVPVESIAELLATREMHQQYRGALEDLKANEAASTTAIAGDEAVEEDKTSSPFQITPKPSGNE